MRLIANLDRVASVEASPGARTSRRGTDRTVRWRLIESNPLAKPQYDGKTVVIVWQHHHIADKQENDEGDTFWSLLQLGNIAHERVPKKWQA